MLGPDQVEAGADVCAVVLKGVGMFGGNKDKSGSAQPNGTVTISTEAMIYGALIIAAALLLAALAGGALIHHGLTHLA